MSSLTYATIFPYLLGLGQRFVSIGRAEFTLDGQALAAEGYPLLLIEADAQGSELIGDRGRPTGQDTFTVAVQVLDHRGNPTEADLLAMLAATNTWADQLTQQLRDERPGQLGTVNKLALPGQAGTDLATGWRLELTLKVEKDLDRTTNAGLFAPLPA